MTSFFVEGAPQGKGRPRFTGKRAYTPKRTVDYEKQIAQAYDGECLAGALFVDVTAFFPIPKSYSKAQKNAIEKGNLTPTKKPDADNIGKIVLDALNGVAYEDDKQVINLRVRKKYAVGTRVGLRILIGEEWGIEEWTKYNETKLP